MALKRQLPSPDAESDSLYESSSIHDRGSVFKAIFSTSTTHLNDPKLLQKHEPFKDAMHRILAYRRQSTQKSLSFANNKKIYIVSSDEDGERYAGKKLEKVLEDLNVEGVLVVARWYGGVLLGPVRFDHIANVAREAVALWKAATSQQNKDGKKIRIAGPETGPVNPVDEVKERERLVRILNERDTSVVVLRGLLAEKTEQLLKLERSQVDIDLGRLGSTKEAQVNVEALVTPDVAGESTSLGGSDDKPDTSGSQITPASSAAVSSPSTKLDYSGMPLQRLRQLEKARDASLGWILKQIDATEVKIKDAERNLEKSTLSQVTEPG